MLGYAKFNIEDVRKWIKDEKARITDAGNKEENNNEKPYKMKDACWYSSRWTDYFYHKQEEYKDGEPLINLSRPMFYTNDLGSVIKDRGDEFISLVNSVEAEGQRLIVYYADETAALVGYQSHRYILPAELVKVEHLKDYSNFTSGELAALGDKQMSEAMLPADISDSSVKSLEDDLSKKKEEMDAVEQKYKTAIEKIRDEARRKEQELMELMAKETEKLQVMKEELEKKILVLDTQIYGIRCYLGEVVNFTQVRSGTAASSDTPVIMFQKIRYLDEELGKYLSLYSFGRFEDDQDTLIGALRSRDDLRDIFCPADRCVTVLCNSRTGKAVKASELAANVLEKYEYLHGKQMAILVRDGENLYIGWTDEERVNLSSEDLFIRPGVVMVEADKDEEYGFGHRYWSKEEKLKAEKKEAKAEMNKRISRFFIMSVIQGMVDRGDLINIPQGTKITEESELVKFSFAEGWLKDTSYGTFDTIMAKSKDIGVQKGEVVLTGMTITRDDIHDYSRNHNSEYSAYINNRGIGSKNRTHGASIPGFKLMPINKVLKEVQVNVTFDLIEAEPVVNPSYYYRDNAKAYSVAKRSNGKILGTHTCKLYLNQEDFNEAGTLVNYEKVILGKNADCRLWCVDEDGELKRQSVTATRYEWLPDLTEWGIPEIKSIEVLDEDYHTYISVPMSTWTDSGARVNFEIMPDEYLRTTYICSTWLKYVITTGNIGDMRICGSSLNYAEALRYLNKLVEHVNEREKGEKELLLAAGGEDYVKNHTEWDRELCEWRIKNRIAALTSRSAKKFLKECAGK